MEVLRHLWIAFEALAKPHDEVVDGAGGGIHLVTPDPVQDVFPRHDGAGLLGQEFHDHGFLVCERVLAAVPRGGVIRQKVDGIAVEAERLPRTRVPVAAAQHGGDAQQQFPEMKRLGQVIVPAGFQAADAVFGGALDGKKQHRRVQAVAAQFLAGLEPVHLRHHHVQQNQVEAARERLAQAFHPVMGHLRGIALGLENFAHAVGQVLLVVHHEDPGRICRRVHAGGPAAGHSTVTVAPRPGPSLAALTRAPESSARPRTR